MTNIMQHASRIAVIAALAVTPATLFAQTATPETDDGTDTQVTDAETPVTDDTAQTAETPVTDGATEEGATETAEAEEQPAKPVEGQIAMQDENSILANDLIGSNVYSQQGDSIGEIDDLIVMLDGNVDGVVIGVGGFLGMGEKWVAVKMESLETATDENGNVRLMTSATKEDLEAADAFITADVMKAAKRSVETMPQEDPAATDAETTTEDSN